MAFNKKTWKDRITQYPNRRTLTDINTSQSQTVTVARNEGTVSEIGDVFNAFNMNNLEDRIYSEFSSINGVLNGFKIDTLYDGNYTGTAGDITLAHPYTDYEMLAFVYGHNSDLSSASGWTDCKFYPKQALQKIQTNDKGIALFGYNNRWGLYHIASPTSLTRYSSSGTDTCYVIGVYGINAAPGSSGSNSGGSSGGGNSAGSAAGKKFLKAGTLSTTSAYGTITWTDDISGYTRLVIQTWNPSTWTCYTNNINISELSSATVSKSITLHTAVTVSVSLTSITATYYSGSWTGMPTIVYAE